MLPHRHFRFLGEGVAHTSPDETVNRTKGAGAVGIQSDAKLRSTGACTLRLGPTVLQPTDPKTDSQIETLCKV
jgi:hypothetical protein